MDRGMGMKRIDRISGLHYRAPLHVIQAEKEEANKWFREQVAQEFKLLKVKDEIKLKDDYSECWRAYRFPGTEEYGHSWWYVGFGWSPIRILAAGGLSKECFYSALRGRVALIKRKRSQTQIININQARYEEYKPGVEEMIARLHDFRIRVYLSDRYMDEAKVWVDGRENSLSLNFYSKLKDLEGNLALLKPSMDAVMQFFDSRALPE